MDTPALLKRAGAVAALAAVSACGSASTVAPSAAAPSMTHVGKTLFVGGRPVTAARLNAVPRFAQLVPDTKKSAHYEYVFNYYGSYGSQFNYPASSQMVGQIDGRRRSRMYQRFVRLRQENYLECRAYEQRGLRNIAFRTIR